MGDTWMFYISKNSFYQQKNDDFETYGNYKHGYEYLTGQAAHFGTEELRIEAFQIDV